MVSLVHLHPHQRVVQQHADRVQPGGTPDAILVRYERAEQSFQQPSFAWLGVQEYLGVPRAGPIDPRTGMPGDDHDVVQRADHRQELRDEVDRGGRATVRRARWRPWRGEAPAGRATASGRSRGNQDEPPDPRASPARMPMAPSLLDLQVTTTAGDTVVEVGGEIDVATAPEFRDCLYRAIDTQPRRVVADLRQVSFIDSVGLGVLVGAQRRLRTHADRSIELVCAEGLVLRILRLTGLDRTFLRHATLTDALGDDPSRAKDRSGQRDDRSPPAPHDCTRSRAGQLCLAIS